MDGEVDEYFGFALAEVEGHRRGAEEKLFELEEGSGVLRWECEEKNGRSLSL